MALQLPRPRPRPLEQSSVVLQLNSRLVSHSLRLMPLPRWHRSTSSSFCRPWNGSSDASCCKSGDKHPKWRLRGMRPRKWPNVPWRRLPHESRALWTTTLRFPTQAWQVPGTCLSLNPDPLWFLCTGWCWRLCRARCRPYPPRQVPHPTVRTRLPRPHLPRRHLLRQHLNRARSNPSWSHRDQV